MAFIGCGGSDENEKIPDGIKVYANGGPYYVYGGTFGPPGEKCVFEIAGCISSNFENYGYKFLGSGISTQQFSGNYGWYLIKATNDVYIDAFEFLGTSNFCWVTPPTFNMYCSNFTNSDEPTGGDPSYARGAPDGKYAILKAFVLFAGYGTREYDITPPEILSIDPLDGATNVAVDNNIQIIFNEAMDSSTFTKTTFIINANDNNIVGDIVCFNNTDCTQSNITFYPTVDLTPSTTYTVTITKEIKDASGNAVSDTIEWCFTTESIENEENEI